MGGQEAPTGTRRSGLSASARGHSSPEFSESHPDGDRLASGRSGSTGSERLVPGKPQSLKTAE